MQLARRACGPHICPATTKLSCGRCRSRVPAHGEVLLRMKASTICGSDIRCIYHEHLGKGPEGYQGVIAGHEPCGQIVETGPGCRRFGEGDRVIVYHISGCGVCNDCRRGYMISCTSEKYRRAYGWQRDGGMADFMLAEEKDLIALPDELSYADGAQVACGFGTVYEGLEKDRDQRQPRGADHRARTGRTGHRGAVPQAWRAADHRHRRRRRSAWRWPRSSGSATKCLHPVPDNVAAGPQT